jgi:hypothetical protein
MTGFGDARYKYMRVDKWNWSKTSKKTGKVIKLMKFFEVKKVFSKEYDRKLVNRVMKRQGMKGKDGRKVAKGLVKAYRLGKIGAEALY